VKVKVTKDGVAGMVVSVTELNGEPDGLSATVAVTVAVPAVLDGVYVTVATPVEPVLVVPEENVPAAIVPAVADQVTGTPGSAEPSVAVRVTAAVPATKVVSEDVSDMAPGAAMDQSVKTGPT